MRVSGGRKKMVVAAVAIACCLLIIDTLPLRAVGEVSEDAAEEFWEQFLKPSYPGSTASLTPLEKSVLEKFAKDRRETKGLKYGGIGAVAGGGLLALLAPMLRLKSTENYVRGAREVPVDVLQGEKPGSQSSADEESPGGKSGVLPSYSNLLPETNKPGIGKRLKAFFTPSKDADWSKRGSNAAAVAATAFLLGGLGLLVAAHVKARKMKKVRRKLRPFLAQERREMEDDCGFQLRPDCMTEIMMQQIEEARNPTGPLNNTPPTFP